MNNKTIKTVIIAISVIVPLVVALLYTDIQIVNAESVDFTFLPGFNALINSITFVLLILSLIAIKNKKQHLHRLLMMSCVLLSVVFLVSYVLFHTVYQETSFGGNGTIKYVYYFVLLTHVVLSAIVLPLVMYALYYAFVGDFAKHRKIVKFAYPVWVYVAFTGVLVYYMISPYYKFILK